MKTLIEARMETGLSRMRFAGIVGMPHQQLRRYEVGSNRPKARNARRLAAALGVRLDEVSEFQHLVERERSEAMLRERVAESAKVSIGTKARTKTRN